MSRECPITSQRCHDPLCQGILCIREPPIQYESKKTWNELMKKFDAQPWQFYRDKDTTIAHLAAAIDRLTKGEEHHGTKLVLSGIKYKSLTIKNSIIMALSLNVQEFVTSTLGLVDHATQQPITSAVFSNQSYVSNDPTIASVDGSGTVTGLAFGSTNIIVTTDVTYTGTEGQPKTETGKSLLVAVQVFAAALTTDLTIAFSAPQPVVPPTTPAPNA